MLLRPGTGIHLISVEDFAPTGPTSTLLFRWHEVGFSKDKCIRILKKYIEEQKLPENHGLDLNCIENGKSVGTDKYLYSSPAKEWTFGFRSHCHKKSMRDYQANIPLKQVKSVAKLIGRISITDDFKGMQREFDFLSRAIFNKIFHKPYLAKDLNSIWTGKIEPGIYRREHASVMISSEKTQILFDPVFLAPYGTPPDTPWLRPSLSQGIPPDAVFISHSHLDHWHIPTIIGSLNATGSCVFTPHVPKPSVLCPDFASELKVTGIAHRVARWGETIKVGDVEIDVLPFYGEQPSATLSPRDPNLRNWGNCYRVNTPQFSAFILVDSGRDALGDMATVVRDSVKRRGPADAVLACMREFRAPFFPTGLEAYIGSLSFSQLEQLSKEFKSKKLQSSTAGLDPKRGIASICSAAKAKCFLPYAQGYAGHGVPIPAHDWGPDLGSERVAMNFLGDQLRKLRIKTIAQTWNPGDRIYFKDKEIIRMRF